MSTRAMVSVLMVWALSSCNGESVGSTTIVEQLESCGLQELCHTRVITPGAEDHFQEGWSAQEICAIEGLRDRTPGIYVHEERDVELGAMTSRTYVSGSDDVLVVWDACGTCEHAPWGLRRAPA